MTIILESQTYRNNRGNATIIVEKYQDKGASVPFWRIAYKYDSYPCAITYKGMMKHKPHPGMILNVCSYI